MKCKYWSYDGNHPDGKDHARSDPAGVGVPAIGLAAAIIDGSQCHLPAHLEKKIPTLPQWFKVYHAKGDNFGHEVTVDATKEFFELCAQLTKEFWAWTNR